MERRCSNRVRIDNGHNSRLLPPKRQASLHVGNVRHDGFERESSSFSRFSFVLPFPLNNCDSEFGGTSGRGANDRTPFPVRDSCSRGRTPDRKRTDKLSVFPTWSSLPIPLISESRYRETEIPVYCFHLNSLCGVCQIELRTIVISRWGCHS